MQKKHVENGKNSTPLKSNSEKNEKLSKIIFMSRQWGYFSGPFA